MTPKLKVTKAKASLVMEQPFFGCLALRLMTVETKEIPTLATDGLKLLYNPDYIDTLDTDLIRSAIAHEVMHAALAHPLRRYNRNPILWNIATDYAINPLIKEAGFKLHESWLFEEKYVGKDADTIFNLLPEPEIIKVSGCGMLHDHPIAGGRGDGEGKDGDKKKGGMGKHLSESEKREAEAEAKIVLAQAAAIAKTCGKLPAGIERMVENIVNPKVDWRQKLRLFLEEISKNDYSWVRPSRKLLPQGMYMPSLYSLEVGEVVIAVDTSGSIAQKELTAFASEISAILDTVTPKQIYVIYCDAAIAGEVEEYDKYDLPLNLEPRGGGGTSFKPPFQWVADHDITPKCLIYFTDMCCWDFPDEEPPYPVMWMNTSNSGEAPWGEINELEL